MHILIINLNLDGIDRSRYESVRDEVAPALAAIPGLISKKWIAHEETNTYGGVYRFKDKQAMLDCQASELFDSVGGDPAFANVTASDFEMIAAPSRITRVD